MRDNCSKRSAEHSEETLIDEECWLFVSVLGMKLRVYKSTELRETDEMYRPVLEITGRGAPISRRLVRDASMMFGMAEDLVFDIAEKVASDVERGHRSLSRLSLFI